MFDTHVFLDIAPVMAVVAAACAVPGVFLLLRRMALVADAISHVLLFGIVAAYLVVRDLSSPWLMVGAAASGVLTVALVEAIQRTKLVKEDAAIGLVFPALFALGAILATMYTRDVHLDADSVLLGNPEFATQDRMRVGRWEVPRAAVVMGGMLLATVVVVGLLFKELKLTTFDPALAAALGFRPGLVHYALMTVVALTVVAAFDAVGPVLVVAFLVVPPSAAYLLTDRLSTMLGLSVLIAVIGSVGGVAVALRFDTNIAGTAATLLGVLFGVVWLFAPGRGLIADRLRRWRQRRAFLETVLAIHLYQHEGTDAEADEAGAGGLHQHLGWPPGRVAEVVGRAGRHGLVVWAGDLLKLTPAGRARAAGVLGDRPAAGP
jgi:manganese/zinc/iron transport system permease protein